MIFAGRRHASISPAQAAAALVRIAYLERALANVMAGWAVKLPALDAKLAFAEQMQRSIERATALRSRVYGLCHAVAGEARVEAGWRAMMERIDRAPTPALLLAAIYRWLYPRLIALYRAHLRDTDPVADRASVELIETFLPRIERERRDGLALARAILGGEARAWLRALDRLWDERAAGESLPLDEAVWLPVDRVPVAVRAEGLARSPPGSLGVLPVDPLNDPRDIGSFLHKELDEEYTTLELIARNSYEHPAMPWAFHRDMARQASDEARHARIITRLMEARGFRHGDFAVSTASYDALYAFEPCAPGSREELLWRMLVRQTFEEGLAIDNLTHEIERRRAAGQEDIANALDYILRDEVFHAQSGLRWSRELLGGDRAAVARLRAQAIGHLAKRAEAAREAYVMANMDEAMAELATIEAGKAARAGKPPERPLNRTGRAQAGFDEEDIRQILSLGYATDEPEAGARPG